MSIWPFYAFIYSSIKFQVAYFRKAKCFFQSIKQWMGKKTTLTQSENNKWAKKTTLTLDPQRKSYPTPSNVKVTEQNFDINARIRSVII